jgi:hypothetical protein
MQTLREILSTPLQVVLGSTARAVIDDRTIDSARVRSSMGRFSDTISAGAVYSVTYLGVVSGPLGGKAASSN